MFDVFRRTLHPKPYTRLNKPRAEKPDISETEPGPRFLVTWGFPKISAISLGCPDTEDYSILGSNLGSLYFGKLPLVVGGCSLRFRDFWVEQSLESCAAYMVVRATSDW